MNAWPPLTPTGIELVADGGYNHHQPDNIIFDIYPFGSTILKGAITAGFTANVVVVDNKTDTTLHVLASDNSYSFNISNLLDPLVIAFQNGGHKFKPNHQYVKGDIVRPTFFDGWVYEVIEPGTSTTEPVWWVDAHGDNIGNIGTAKAKAVIYHQPLVHGPIAKETA